MTWKKGSTVFLKGVIILIGILVLGMCLIGFPMMASRDAAKHPDSAYLQYWFLVYVFVLCLPFYIALYQAFKLLSFIDINRAFSKQSIRALKYIKYCAMILGALILFGIITAIALFYGNEDLTGIIMLALISIVAAFIIATFAAVLQKLLQKAVDLKSENDLVI